MSWENLTTAFRRFSGHFFGWVRFPIKSSSENRSSTDCSIIAAILSELPKKIPLGSEVGQIMIPVFIWLNEVALGGIQMIE